MPLPAWMPDLMELPAYGGNWNAYLDALHVRFEADFVGQELTYRAKRVGLKRHPIVDGKNATFWHFISEGAVEAERLPDLRRCERICWPRAIIDNCDDECLLTWGEDDQRGARVMIWCESAEYLLVLADRGDYVLPWTGYPVPQPHRQRKLRQRFESAQNG